MCKVHANAGCLGPRDQTEDDNPGGTLCGPANGASQMGGEEGRRRCRQKERATVLGPVSLSTSFSIRTQQIQLPL